VVSIHTGSDYSTTREYRCAGRNEFLPAFFCPSYSVGILDVVYDREAASVKEL
jgi:hypothetical protein